MTCQHGAELSKKPPGVGLDTGRLAGNQQRVSRRAARRFRPQDIVIHDPKVTLGNVLIDQELAVAPNPGPAWRLPNEWPLREVCRDLDTKHCLRFGSIRRHADNIIIHGKLKLGTAGGDKRLQLVQRRMPFVMAEVAGIVNQQNVSLNWVSEDCFQLA